MQLGERKTLKIQDSSQEDITLVPDTDDLLSIHRIKKQNTLQQPVPCGGTGCFFCAKIFAKIFLKKC